MGLAPVQVEVRVHQVRGVGGVWGVRITLAVGRRGSTGGRG